MMGFLILILGLVIFLGAHSFISVRGARTSALARLGAAYWLLFGLSAIVGLALIVWGFALYSSTVWIDIWSPPSVMRYIAIALMWFSVVLVMAAYLPGHIKIWTKQPMLAGIKIWAFAHLLSNGDLGSILLFGSFLAWGVYARIAAKRRGDAGTASTPAGWTNDIIVVVVGIVIYLALGYAFHPMVLGVPVFGR
jgi:uncharacterized membrane protein